MAGFYSISTEAPATATLLCAITTPFCLGQGYVPKQLLRALEQILRLLQQANQGKLTGKILQVSPLAGFRCSFCRVAWWFASGRDASREMI